MNRGEKTKIKTVYFCKYLLNLPDRFCFLKAGLMVLVLFLRPCHFTIILIQCYNNTRCNFALYIR